MPLTDPDVVRRLCEIEWEYPDSIPELMYGDRELAVATRVMLTEHDLTELRPPFVSVERDHETGSAIAFLVRCRESELASIRLGATLFLMRSGFYREHPDVEARSHVATRLLVRGRDDDYHLTHLWVAPDARGRGLGRSLILRCIDEARAAGCARVLVETSARNESAVRLYESTGFRVAGEASVIHPRTGADVVWVHLENMVGAPPARPDPSLRSG